MHGAYSETWWWQCPYVGLHECCWCRELHFIDGIMNSQMYCSILKEKMLPSLRALGCRALFQHDNDSKHTLDFCWISEEQGESDSVAKYVS